MKQMKSIITSEIINLVKNDITEFPNININPFKFLPAQAITIGVIRVVKHPSGCYLYLPDDVGDTYMTEWKQDVGELLYKDFKKEKYSKYYELLTQTPDVKYKVLLRLADDSEFDDLKERGFIHLTIGDNSYTIIKCVPSDDSYISRESGIYMNEPAKSDDDNDSDETYDRSFENDAVSISLFE